MASGTRSRRAARNAPQGPENPCPYRMKLLPKQKISVSQLRILLTAVEKDPSLYNASESDMVSFLNIEKWFDLSDQLNECLDGTMLNIQNWKCVLRFWAENIKKGDVMSEKRLAFNKSNKSITLKEAKELTRLERRLYKFIKNEKANNIVDMIYTGNFGAEQHETAIAAASDNGIKVMQLMNVSPLTIMNNENACPEGPKKRKIHLKEDNRTDPSDVTKKRKYIFNEDLGEPQIQVQEKRQQANVEDPHHQLVEEQLDRLQAVSRELEEHIATIQNRIHFIKDLWKHRCGDN